MILVYMTTSSEEEAKNLSKAVLEKRLASCANIFQPHHSMYWWDDKIEETTEFVTIFKTRDELFDPIKDFIVEHHSYDVPCVLSISMDVVSEEFGEWIAQETQPLKKGT